MEMENKHFSAHNQIFFLCFALFRAVRAAFMKHSGTTGCNLLDGTDDVLISCVLYLPESNG